MCKAKPEPRCAYHLRQDISRVRLALANEEEASKKEALQSKLSQLQMSFYGTKSGQREILGKIAREEDAATKNKLAVLAARSKEHRTKEHERAKKQKMEALTTMEKNTHYVSLKDMSIEDMRATLVHVADSFDSPQDRIRVKEAIAFATEMHKDDIRKNGTLRSDGTLQEEHSPYIVHPMRNAMRIVRWGQKDSSVVSAALLHDVVEDHYDDIAAIAGTPDDASDEEKTEASHEYMRQRFGKKTSDIVRGMSNPLLPRYMPRAERNAHYAAHVEEAVNSDPNVFLNKFADFADNALSLHNNIVKPEINQKLATKYLPLVSVFERSYDKHQEFLEENCTELARDDIQRRLEKGREYLIAWSEGTH